LAMRTRLLFIGASAGAGAGAGAGACAGPCLVKFLAILEARLLIYQEVSILRVAIP